MRLTTVLRTAAFFLISMLLLKGSFAQQDTCDIRVSLLTCSPGEDLYSIFGHSALRVTYKGNSTDVIFNYGTFDFDDPGFYQKFVLGKLLYYVATERVNDFLYAYQWEQRGVIEQVLSLTCEQRRQIFAALEENLKEENKHYAYHFFFDNCSTRLRDILANNTGAPVRFGEVITAPAPTFRELITRYLNQAKQYWSKAGIDLLLGSRIDVKVSNAQAMFLPDLLMKGFDSAKVSGKPLVALKRTILPARSEAPQASVITPMIATLIILVAAVLLTLLRSRITTRIVGVFDVALFLVLGIAGCLILFMWFGTEHELCDDNYNVIWATPTHLIMSFFLLRPSRLNRMYFGLSTLLYILVCATWVLLPQEMNMAFLPLCMAAGIRSYALFRKNKPHDDQTNQL